MNNTNENEHDKDRPIELNLLSELAEVRDYSRDAEILGLVAPAWLQSASRPREFVCFHSVAESPEATRPCLLVKVTGILAPGATGSTTCTEFIVTDGDTIVVPLVTEAVNWNEAREILELSTDTPVPPAAYGHWVVAWYNGIPDGPGYDYGYRLGADGWKAVWDAISNWPGDV